MFVPRYSRIDEGKLTCITTEELTPFLTKAFQIYTDNLREEYGEHLLSVDEAIQKSLAEHYIVLINGEYLLGYTVGSEWYSKGILINEEYLIRVNEGSTSLEDVFDVLGVLTLVHKAVGYQVGTRAAKNKKAIRRLYSRYGLKEVMTVMRY